MIDPVVYISDLMFRREGGTARQPRRPGRGGRWIVPVRFWAAR
ncbi:hypothetical protein [Aestuariicoccus sp. MJ-SS9]|nr:hypothetical protein [Aestuariicoccus sp. MJ-SS9]MDU8911837.1 hypothetical protein [Aestuariicoccus sp. MJ-SS9]